MSSLIKIIFFYVFQLIWYIKDSLYSFSEMNATVDGRKRQMSGVELCKAKDFHNLSHKFKHFYEVEEICNLHIP